MKPPKMTNSPTISFPAPAPSPHPPCADNPSLPPSPRRKLHLALPIDAATISTIDRRRYNLRYQSSRHNLLKLTSVPDYAMSLDFPRARESSRLCHELGFSKSSRK